ncbi:MAG: hypothetical protein HFF50_06805 [Lawsonibacter sp.]|nr:hypothetical protein [Lawsonibacter sp.]
MKRAVYWLGYAVLLAGGIFASWKRLLPVQNTYIFLMGLIWLWSGFLMAFNFSEYGDHYKRSVACKRIHGVIFLAMGGVWIPLSLTPLAHRGMPVFLASVPFLLLLCVTAHLDKKKRLEKTGKD